MTRAEEEAQIAAAIAAGKITRCPTVSPEDAVVSGMLAARVNRKQAPRFAVAKRVERNREAAD